MALTNLSQVTSSGIHTLSNYTTHNINSTGIITATEFSGNLSNSSGISTFAEIRVTGNLTVEGTTTTLDSNLTEVDRIEVGANSTNPGIAVTQSGTGAAATFEGGNVGIGTDNPNHVFELRKDSALTSAGQYPVIQISNANASGYSHLTFTSGQGTYETAGILAYNGDTSLRFRTNGGTERLRITSDGKVGIGASSPSRILQIKAPSQNTPHIVLVDNDSNNEIWQVGNQSDGDGFMTLRTDEGTTSVLFDASGTNYINGGNVGIGTNNPAANIDVQRSGTGTIARFGVGDGTTNLDIKYSSNITTFDQQNNKSIAFETANTERLRITSDGEVTINNSDSDPSVLNLKGGGSSVLNGDEFAQVKFFTQDVNVSGSDRQCARISSIAENDHGSSEDARTAIGFYTRRDESQSPVERLRITHAGDVGIGVTNPTSFGPTLQVSGTDPALLLQDTATAVDFYGINVQSGSVINWFDDSAYFAIGTATGLSGGSYSEKLRIDSDGQVQIGSGTIHGGGHLTIRGGGVNTYACQDYQYVGTPSSNDTLSQIRFTANTSGANVPIGARIQAAADDAWSATGDAPTRLQFYTTPNSSATQVERLRIKSNGEIKFANNNSSTDYLEWGGNPRLMLQAPAGLNGLRVYGTTTPFEIGGSVSTRKVSMGGDPNYDLSISASYSLSSGEHDSSPKVFLNATRHNGSSTVTSFQTSIQAVSVSNTAGDGYLGLGASATPDDLVIRPSGNIGINDTAPSQKLNVGGNIMLEGSDQYLYLTNVGTGNAGIYVRGRDSTDELRSHSTGVFTWEVTGNEKMRLTSDGRMHVGYNASTNAGTDQVNIVAAGSGINISRLQSGSPSQNEWLGALGFKGYASGNSSSGADARIHARAAAAHSGTSAPADLIFSTKPVTTGPGSSPTERLKITANGQITSGNLSINAFSYQDNNITEYTQMACDNHANTFFGQNLKLGASSGSGSHTLEVINQHSTIGGAGMYIGGNQNTTRINSVTFYAVAANQGQGTDVTNQDRLRITTDSTYFWTQPTNYYNGAQSYLRTFGFTFNLQDGESETIFYNPDSYRRIYYQIYVQSGHGSNGYGYLLCNSSRYGTDFHTVDWHVSYTSYAHSGSVNGDATNNGIKFTRSGGTSYTNITYYVIVKCFSPAGGNPFSISGLTDASYRYYNIGF